MCRSVSVEKRWLNAVVFIWRFHLFYARGGHRIIMMRSLGSVDGTETGCLDPIAKVADRE